MKPLVPINHKEHSSASDNRAGCSRHSFPLTDYNYHSTAETKVSSSAVRPITRSPAFHKLSSEFFGAETSRDYVAELLFFILITGIAAWPVVTMLIAVIRLIRNY